MKAAPTPYIGVSGITDASHAAALAATSRFDRPTMLGVLVSPGTLAGKPSRMFPKRYPRADSIASLFPDHDGVLNCVHLSGCTGANLRECLLEVEKVSGPRLDAIQINCGFWPRMSTLASWRKAKRSRSQPPLLILQISGRCLPRENGDMSRAAARAARYSKIVDHLLFDQSNGQGLSLDLERASEFATLVREQETAASLGIGFAGGFKPANAYLATTLLARGFGDQFSVDAESGLRDDGDDFALDSALAYVRDVRSAFAQAAS
jgi:hypothetical protein